jgi:hypothetical protein
MDHESFDGVACGLADLTARVKGDLVTAMQALARAEQRCRDAERAGLPLSLLLRHQRTTHRQEVASLRRLLAGMPMLARGNHAASA